MHLAVGYSRQPLQRLHAIVDVQGYTDISYIRPQHEE